MRSAATRLITVAALIAFGTTPSIADDYSSAGPWLVTQTSDAQSEIPFACFLEQNASTHDFYLYLLKDKDELVLEIPLDAAHWLKLSPGGPRVEALVAFDGKRAAVEVAGPNDEDGALMIPAGDTKQFLKVFGASRRMTVTARGVKLLDLRLGRSAVAVRLLEACKAAYVAQHPAPAPTAGENGN
jgi:hypothetical protein